MAVGSGRDLEEAGGVFLSFDCPRLRLESKSFLSECIKT